jgi:hypothetical protein
MPIAMRALTGRRDRLRRLMHNPQLFATWRIGATLLRACVAVVKDLPTV